jgi:RimJ/RimL family protein N-acetyltransferase
MIHEKRSAVAFFKPGRGKFIIGKMVRFREKRLSDARLDHSWQSDPELARLDAALPLKISLPVYLLDYAEEITYPGDDRHTLALETLEGKHIGNCTLYDINESKGETQLGIMIGNRDYWDKGYGADAINTIVNRVFIKTQLKRIYLMTLDWNTRAQKCFTKCGFIPCGEVKRDSYTLLIMELLVTQWLERRELIGADA